MEKYAVEFDREAEEDLARLDKPLKKRVVEKIEWLRDNLDKITHISLGFDFKDFYKLRVGGWRIIYILGYKENKIIIAYIDRRDKIYKRMRKLSIWIKQERL